MKTIYFDPWEFRCRIRLVGDTEFRVVFEERYKFLWIFNGWTPIYKRGYIFSISNEPPPKDDRPRIPTSTIEIAYVRHSYEVCFNNFDLRKRIDEIADEIIDDIKANAQVGRRNRKQYNAL